MIERWVSNELTLKRIRRFQSIKRAVWSLYLVLFLIFISVTASLRQNRATLENQIAARGTPPTARETRQLERLQR